MLLFPSHHHKRDKRGAVWFTSAESLRTQNPCLACITLDALDVDGETEPCARGVNLSNFHFPKCWLHLASNQELSSSSLKSQALTTNPDQKLSSSSEASLWQLNRCLCRAFSSFAFVTLFRTSTSSYPLIERMVTTRTAKTAMKSKRSVPSRRRAMSVGKRRTVETRRLIDYFIVVGVKTSSTPSSEPSVDMSPEVIDHYPTIQRDDVPLPSSIANVCFC